MTAIRWSKLGVGKLPARSVGLPSRNQRQCKRSAEEDVRESAVHRIRCWMFQWLKIYVSTSVPARASPRGEIRGNDLAKV